MWNQVNYLICILCLAPFPLLSQDIIIEKGTDLTIENGWNIKLSQGGNLIIREDESGSGSLIDKNSTSSVYFSGGGEAQVELFLKEDQWHYVASPVNDAISGIFWDIYLKEYSEPDSLWSFITSPDQLLTPFKGYAAWPSSSYTGDVTVTFNGELNAGVFSSTVTNSGALNISGGFNFMGNPYPSAINWQVGSTGWTRTNVDPTIYMWNPVAGQYGSYNRNTKAGTNDVDSIIQAKQGFFVHATSAPSGPLIVPTGTLAVNNNARLHDHHNITKSKHSSGSDEFLDLVVTGNEFQDETIIMFNDSANAGFDPKYEAYKLPGSETAPQLYTRDNEILLSVNAIKKTTGELIIPLYFETGVSGPFQITAKNPESFSAYQDVYLEDLFENTIQDLKLNPSYDFYANSEDGKSRFLIHFKNEASVSDQGDRHAFQIYANNQTVYINLPQKSNGRAEIFDLMGRLILREHLGPGLNNIPVRLHNQSIIVRLISGQYIESKKLFIQ